PRTGSTSSCSPRSTTTADHGPVRPHPATGARTRPPRPRTGSPHTRSRRPMMRYALRRVASFAVMLLTALTVLFLLLHALPDESTYGLSPTVAADPEARAAAMESQGLD